jgi:ABC-type phosphate transport system ATPase subunit
VLLLDELSLLLLDEVLSLLDELSLLLLERLLEERLRLE